MAYIDLRFDWVDDDHFTLYHQAEGEGSIKIVNMEENASIKALWGHITGATIAHVSQLMSKIGKEMGA